MIKKIISIFVMITLLSCETTQPTVENESTISNIPNIVKALEAISSVGKKTLDKDEKK